MKLGKSEHLEKWEKLAIDISHTVSNLQEVLRTVHNITVVRGMAFDPTNKSYLYIKPPRDPDWWKSPEIEELASLYEAKVASPMDAYRILFAHLLANIEYTVDKSYNIVAHSELDVAGARGKLSLKMAPIVPVGRDNREQKIRFSDFSYTQTSQSLSTELIKAWDKIVGETLISPVGSGGDKKIAYAVYLEELSRKISRKVNPQLLHAYFPQIFLVAVAKIYKELGWNRSQPLIKLELEQVLDAMAEVVDLIMGASEDIARDFSGIRFNTLVDQSKYSSMIADFIFEVEEEISRYYGDEFYIDLMEYFKGSIPDMTDSAFTFTYRDDSGKSYPAYIISGLASMLASLSTTGNYLAMTGPKVFYYLFLHEILHQYRRDVEYLEIARSDIDPEKWPQEIQAREMGTPTDPLLDNIKMDIFINALVDKLFSPKELSFMATRQMHNEIFYDLDGRNTRYWSGLVWDQGESGIRFDIVPLHSERYTSAPLRKKRMLNWRHLVIHDDLETSVGKYIADVLLIISGAMDFLFHLEEIGSKQTK